MFHNEIEKKRPNLFFLGFIAASSLTLTAFSWQYEVAASSFYNPLEAESLLIEIDMDRIFIERKEKEMKASVSSRKKSNNIIALDRPKEVISKLLNNSKKMRPITNSRSENPIERDLAASNSPEIRSYRSLAIHEMPYLRSCGHIKDDVERFQCTQSEIRKHIRDEFHVSSFGMIADIPDRVEVIFTIDEFGNIEDISSKEALDHRLLNEVLKVFRSMPEMVPAASDGRRIAVRFEIPIAIQRR